MPRSYWWPILAVVGLAASAHAQPVGRNGGGQASAQAGQTVVTPNTNPSIPPAIQNDLDSIARSLEAANQKQPSAEEDQRAKQDLQAQKDMAWWAMLMFWAATFEAAITGLGVFLVWRTLEATWAAKDEAKRAADAAHATLEQAERHARQELRAYVSAEPNFIVAFDTGSHAGARAEVRNLGSTPAHDVTTLAAIDVFPHPLPKAFTIPNIHGNRSAPATLFPGRELVSSCTSGRLFTADEIGTIRDGSFRIYVFGETIYRDIFGMAHKTEFCRSIRADDETLVKLTSAYKPSDLEVRFQTTEQHNAAT